MKATAAVLYEVNKPLVVEDVEVLEPGPHEVRVRWTANGVCHSDLHVVTGDSPTRCPWCWGTGGRSRREGGARGGNSLAGRPRVLELHSVVRQVRVLHRRSTHHVRAP